MAIVKEMSAGNDDVDVAVVSAAGPSQSSSPSTSSNHQVPANMNNGLGKKKKKAPSSSSSTSSAAAAAATVPAVVGREPTHNHNYNCVYNYNYNYDPTQQQQQQQLRLPPQYMQHRQPLPLPPRPPSPSQSPYIIDRGITSYIYYAATPPLPHSPHSPSSSSPQIQFQYPYYPSFMHQLPPPPYTYYIPTPFPIPYINISHYTPHNTPSFAPPQPIPIGDLIFKIVNQIEYYFSDENLATDMYLKRRMDDEGWVPVDLIASFRRVAQLTKDTQFILNSMLYSSTVEVQGDKLRRRGTWKKWLLPQCLRRVC